MTLPAIRNEMLQPFSGATYTTPETAVRPTSRLFPNISFYLRMFTTFYHFAPKAKAGQFEDADWVACSLAIKDALEACGVHITIEGLDVLERLNSPCVFIGNHMSTLETFLLPCIVRPYLPVTFVVKESLMRYPVFHHVMKTRDPIVVERKEARADFLTVMNGGVERLDKGISIIIFPQSTRSLVLDKHHFNSMGIKLARKAGVPVVPIAIRSDAWGMGGLFGLLKDHGAIRPEIPVNIRFGEPVFLEGNGKAEHEAVYSFIEKALLEWELPGQRALLESNHAREKTAGE